jgi:hypothetical protein
MFLHRFEAGRPVLAQKKAVARELTPARPRSGRKMLGSASQPSGSKLPRHSGLGSTHT